MNTPVLTSIKSRFRNVDWFLLVFLVLVLDVKLWMKAVAIVAVYVFRPDFRFGFRFASLQKSRLPVFYCCMAGIAVLDWLLLHQFSAPQTVVLATSLVFWGMCILIIHQVKLFVEKDDPLVIHGTLWLFFLLNNLVSVAVLIGIMFKTGALNPYQFLGMDQTYFISTGDFIKGITFDFSLTNALICMMGIIYFIQRKQFGMTVFTMICLLLTGSNFTNLLVVIVLIVLFFYRSGRAQKITVAVCLALVFIFMKLVSPENKEYAQVTIAAITEKKEFKITPQDTAIPVTQTQIAFNKKAEVIEEKYSFEPTTRQTRLPGKLISFQETVQYLKTHPAKLPFGAGAGHFSSKLAFRATDLGSEGGWLGRFSYIDPDFLHNHLALFLYYFTKGNQHHSIIHTPYSVYNQAFGEYGLAGLLALFGLYFLYFMVRAGKQLFTWLLLAVLGAAFFTDYWFEQLSIVILFELLFFLMIRESGPTASQNRTKE